METFDILTEITKSLIRNLQRQEDTIIARATEFTTKASAIHRAFEDYGIFAFEEICAKMQATVQAAFV